MICLLLACCFSCEEGSKTAEKVAVKSENVLPKLATLPYLARAPVTPSEAQRVGVTQHDRSKTIPGITVVCTEAQSEARFIGLDGTVLHTLRIPGEGCKVIEPYGEHYFVALSRDGTVSMIDWTSHVLWQRKKQKGAYHHDLAVADDGNILVLDKEQTTVPYQGVRLPFLDNMIVTLTSTGKVRDSISLFSIISEVVAAGGPTARNGVNRLFDIVKSGNVPKAEGRHSERVYDILHTNTLEILPRDSVIGKKGQILICVRNADLIAVIDLKEKKVVWSWGPGELDWPHHPTLLDNGNVLIFDNGINRGFSRVVEYDPQAKKIAWEYRSANPKFYSAIRGSVQLLPNGNILVGESDRGRLFEITRQEKIVWEYFTDVDHGEHSKFEEQDTDTLERLLFYRTWRLYEKSYPHAEFATLWKKYLDTIH